MRERGKDCLFNGGKISSFESHAARQGDRGRTGTAATHTSGRSFVARTSEIMGVLPRENGVHVSRRRAPNGSGRVLSEPRSCQKVFFPLDDDDDVDYDLMANIPHDHPGLGGKKTTRFERRLAASEFLGSHFSNPLSAHETVGVLTNHSVRIEQTRG